MKMKIPFLFRKFFFFFLKTDKKINLTTPFFPFPFYFLFFIFYFLFFIFYFLFFSFSFLFFIFYFLFFIFYFLFFIFYFLFFIFYFLFFIFIFNIKTDSSSQKGKAKLLSFDLGDAESQVHTDKEDVSDNWDEEELQLAFRASKQVFFFSFFFFFSS